MHEGDFTTGPKRSSVDFYVCGSREKYCYTQRTRLLTEEAVSAQLGEVRFRRPLC
jgi:hypothetical protein